MSPAAPGRPALLAASTFWGLLEARAASSPQSPLVIDGATGASRTCTQVRDAALGLAAFLHAQGLQPGDTVTWQLPTGWPAFVLQFALARLGVVQNPVISLYGEAELEMILRRQRPRFLLLPDEAQAAGVAARAQRVCTRLAKAPTALTLPEELPAGQLDRLPPEPVADGATQWIHVTSGSTAEPKGACHADRSLLLAGRNLASSLQAGAGDVGTIAFPIAHIGGAMYTAMLLASGASAVLLPKFDAAQAMAAFARHGVTLTGGSTAHYQAFLAEQRRHPERRLIPTLRAIAGGGAPKPPELVAQVREELGCVLAHAYGMTEAPLVASGSPLHDEEQLAHSDGAPCEGVELRIVTLAGADAMPGQEGEIRVRGPGVFLGYTDPALNAAAFDAQGWFRTGDLGRLRPDGHVAVTGRLKDVIIRKGENISAREVEEVLARHPAVREVAVIGLPDAERGERVCAVVVPHDPAEPLSFGAMLGWFEAAGVMRQKIPEQLEHVESLPRLPALNKVAKAALKARFGERTG